MSNAYDKFKTVLNNTRNSVEGVQQDLQFDIVQFIHEKLSEKSMNKSTLAALIKMKESQLSRILNAETNLTLETISRIYWAFKCRPQLVERIERPNTSWASTQLEVAEIVATSAGNNVWNALTVGTRE
jgi:plasmid maintenance system antidote protein VapI